MSEKRLRILNVVVQPVLVWDDGEELTPGPPLDPVTVLGSKLVEFAEKLPADVQALAERLEAEQ